MKDNKKIDEKEAAVKTPAQAEQILEQETIAAHEEVAAEAHAEVPAAEVAAAEVPAVGQSAAGAPPAGRGGRRRGGERKPFSRKPSSLSMMSAKKMLGDLPPSSSVAGIRLLAAACAITRPVVVEPVNALLAMRLLVARGMPASRP